MKKSSSVKKSSSSKRSSKTNYVFFFTLAVGGLLLGYVVVHPLTSVLKADEGMQVSQLGNAKSTITWDQIPGAVSYNVYYKKKDDSGFTTGINVPAKLTSYTIPDLTMGVSYEYKLAAVNAENKEFLWTPVSPLPELQSK